MTAGTAADHGTSALAILGRAAGLAALAFGAFLALMFAFAAAVVVALMIAGAALTMRLWPNRGESEVLQARRTPAGWVVETGARRKV